MGLTNVVSLGISSRTLVSHHGNSAQYHQKRDASASQRLALCRLYIVSLAWRFLLYSSQDKLSIRLP
jgi:hypothetical protein